MKVLATYNIKGGVGKTAAAVNLAYLAADDGLPRCCPDRDQQAAASFYFRVRPKVKGGAGALIGGRPALDRAIKGTHFDNHNLIARRLLLPQHGSRPGRHQAADPAHRPAAATAGPRHDDHAFLDCPPSISLVAQNVFAPPARAGAARPDHALDAHADPARCFLADPSTRPSVFLAFFSMVDQRKNLHRELIAQGPRRADRRARHAGIPATSRRGAHGRAPGAVARLRAAQSGRPQLPGSLGRGRQARPRLSTADGAAAARTAASGHPCRESKLLHFGLLHHG